MSGAAAFICDECHLTYRRTLLYPDCFGFYKPCSCGRYVWTEVGRKQPIPPQSFDGDSESQSYTSEEYVQL